VYRRRAPWRAVAAALLAAPALAQPPPDVLETTPLDPAAAEARGFDYWLGRGVPRDLEQAARWLGEAAAAGRPHATAVLANLYRFGQGVQRDLARAHELDLQAAPLGVAGAQTALGFEASLPRDGALPPDPALGRRWLQAAAEQEDAPALFLLGQMHRFGQGTEANTDLGWQLTARAAELGYPPAAAALGGHLLLPGSGESDVQRGLYFLRAASDAGAAAGAYLLARLHLTGLHVERNAEVAVQLLTRASDRNFPAATLWLAELYAKGLGVEVDLDRAAELRGQVLPRMPVAARNEFAWELAVSRYPELRNGAFAVELMETVTREASTPAYLDTLAAAYAEDGRFEDAARAQQRAIDALPSSASADARASFVERLELYGSGQPYRGDL
jgi:TPR repeat protein